MERVVEPLPLGASSRYSCDPRYPIWFITSDKQIGQVDPKERFFECPLLQVSDQEAKALEAQLIRAAVDPIELRVVDAGKGCRGFFVIGDQP